MKATLRYLAGIAGPSGFGSNSTAEQVTQHCFSFLPSHLTAIITGGSSGIGAETARVLAKRGVGVVIAARDLKKASEVRENIQKESPKAEILLLEINLSSFASVQRFCSEFLASELPLNILINNAGVYSPNLEFSEEKIEMTFATNYTRNARVTINAVHPGIAKTEIIRAHKGLITDSVFFFASKFLKSASQGASTTCDVALRPQTEEVSGKYFTDCNESNCSGLANDELEAQKLWNNTHALLHRQLHQATS